MSMKLIKSINRARVSLLFLASNIGAAIRFKKIERISEGPLSYRGFRKSDHARVNEIYRELSGGEQLSWSRRVLYRFVGSRLIVVASNHSGFEEEIVGINIYYLNSRDIAEKTIHEGFIGVIPKMRGKGIAFGMRSVAKDKFAQEKISGISTRISLNNPSSLQSAISLGFTVIDKYVDEQSGEERYYMLCDLREGS